MSKPLELKEHHKFEDRNGDNWYVWGDTAVRPWIADGYSDHKRLTTPELAAETYKGEAEFRAAAGYGYSADIIRECDRKRSIMERFATLPHYDEGTA